MDSILSFNKEQNNNSFEKLFLPTFLKSDNKRHNTLELYLQLWIFFAIFEL